MQDAPHPADPHNTPADSAASSSKTPALAGVLLGAFIAVAGTLIVPSLTGSQNLELERAKQRNSALTDMWGVHPVPAGMPVAAGDIAEAQRQLLYFTLATPAGINAEARENASGGDGCLGDFSEHCRARMVRLVQASRTDVGAGYVSDATLGLALKPAFDRMEQAVQQLVEDGGEVTQAASGGDPYVVYNMGSSAGLSAEERKAVEAAVTPAFHERFPEARYSIVILFDLVGDNKVQFCQAYAGVSNRSVGMKNVRIPGEVGHATVRASGTDAGGVSACRQRAVEDALHQLMALDPLELARLSERSL